MRTNVFGTIILVASVWTNVIFSHDYETWETAVKNSDLAFFTHLRTEDKIDYIDLQGLLPLADEVVKQREEDIFNRKCRVYTSIALKCLGFTAACPIIGFFLDQRALGVTLGASSFATGFVATLGTSVGLAENNHAILAYAASVIGILATTAAIVGCVKLERWAWQKERNSYEKLEKAYHDAVAIKTRLTILVAKSK